MLSEQRHNFSQSNICVYLCFSYRNLAVTPSWDQSNRRMPTWCVEAKTPPVCITRVCTRAMVVWQVGYTRAHVHIQEIDCSSLKPSQSVDNSRLCAQIKRLLFSDIGHINHGNSPAKKTPPVAFQEEILCLCSILQICCC